MKTKLGNTQFQLLTLVSLLLLMVSVGCSSSDQGAIDKTVSATLEVAQPVIAAPTPTPEVTAVPTPTPKFPIISR